MQLTPELIGVASAVLAHWAHSVRRSSRVESKVDRIERTVEATQIQLLNHTERLARIEGRLNGSAPRER